MHDRSILQRGGGRILVAVGLVTSAIVVGATPAAAVPGINGTVGPPSSTVFGRSVTFSGVINNTGTGAAESFTSVTFANDGSVGLQGISAPSLGPVAAGATNVPFSVTAMVAAPPGTTAQLKLKATGVTASAADVDPQADIDSGVFIVTDAAESPADFDGSGTTDRSVFRFNGGWYVKDQPTLFHGLPGDVPVPADYDGDGDTDKAVYRNGAWYIKDQTTQFHGTASDIPVPADYDGDGDADVAVYRPSNGGWFVKNQTTVFLGNATDVPVPGDYDADGDSDRAVYRPSNGAWFVNGQTTVFFGGISGDIPVPGDYDGDGDTDRAVYRGSGGWYVNGQTTQFFGLSGDKPMPGDYDGDGDIDRAVYRNGAWHVKDQPPVVFFGLSSDRPLPLPAAIYNSFF